MMKRFYLYNCVYLFLSVFEKVFAKERLLLIMQTFEKDGRADKIHVEIVQEETFWYNAPQNPWPISLQSFHVPPKIRGKVL